MCSHMFRHLKDFNMKNFSRKFLNDNGNVYTVCVCVYVCVRVCEREREWCEFDLCPQPGKDIVSLRIKSYA